ncbi:MAG: response regulator [Bryobacteraceae bacterium]|nr:response regulator [Bryobacteraceae bacterium]
MGDQRTTLEIGEIRHIVRTPLHRIISAGESILERRARLGSEALISTTVAILDRCETMLSTLGTAADSQLNNVPFEDIAPELERSGLELAKEAEAAADAKSNLDISAETARITAAAKDFLSEIRQLGATAIAGGNRPLNRTAESAAGPMRGLILVVDDDQDNRDVLSRRLLRDGREVMLAEGGRQAMRMLRRYPFDLVLLDIMMPDMDGYEVLAEIRNVARLKHLPVVMITAVDDADSVARCLELGADDYLPKPFNRTVLTARVQASLERKRLRDNDVKKTAELEAVLAEIDKQRHRTQALLENILPASVAGELRDTGSVQPMYFEDVTIVFADIVGFSISTEQIPADELVNVLHQYFSRFDEIMSLYSLEKLKTIGDCYMFSGGLPERSSSNPVDCVLAALEMIASVEDLAAACEVEWRLRIGVNTGPVVAGVVGKRKFAFDVWGHTVNFAARVESAGYPNRVNLSSSTYARVRDFFDCDKQEKVRTKEGHEVDTYLVRGVSSRLLLKNPLLTPREAFALRYQSYFRKPLVAFPDLGSKTVRAGAPS